MQLINASKTVCSENLIKRRVNLIYIVSLAHFSKIYIKKYGLTFWPTLYINILMLLWLMMLIYERDLDRFKLSHHTKSIAQRSFLSTVILQTNIQRNTHYQNLGNSVEICHYRPPAGNDIPAWPIELSGILYDLDWPLFTHYKRSRSCFCKAVQQLPWDLFAVSKFLVLFYVEGDDEDDEAVAMSAVESVRTGMLFNFLFISGPLIMA